MDLLPDLPHALTTLPLLGRIISSMRIKSENKTMITISPKHERFEASAIGRGRKGVQNRTAVELLPSGVIQLDAALGGGFPRGSLVELCGPHSSGRTSLAFSCLRSARNDRKLVRLWMFRIPLTRFLSRLRVWNFRDCSGFDEQATEWQRR